MVTIGPKCIFHDLILLKSLGTTLYPPQLVDSGDDVLLLYNEQTLPQLVQLMKSSRMKSDKAGELAYHIGLIDLLTLCTEGKNVFTEIKCHSLVPLDDILLIVTHQDCIPEVCVVGVCIVYTSLLCQLPIICYLLQQLIKHHDILE